MDGPKLSVYHHIYHVYEGLHLEVDGVFLIHLIVMLAEEPVDI